MMSDPKTLSILCELLCERKPEERRAKDKPPESIYEQSPEVIKNSLSDADGIPFIIKAVIKSIYDTNAISVSGIGSTDCPPSAKADIDLYGKIFSSHKEPVLKDLNMIHPFTRMGILSEFHSQFQGIIDCDLSVDLYNSIALGDGITDIREGFAKDFLQILEGRACVPWIMLELKLLYDIHMYKNNGVYITNIAPAYAAWFFTFEEEEEEYIFSLFLIKLVENFPALELAFASLH